MTEGNGHIIDPDGQARRALQAAVAEHGPQVLSDPATLDGICQDRLASLPGEYILIGSAARSDVPALLRERTASGSLDEGIQSVAATVAAAHGLDTATCVWVVREFAWALGYPPPGGIPSAPAKPTGPNRSVLGIGAFVAMAVVYLVVAATAHLSPFSGTQTAVLNSPQPGVTVGSPNGSPDAAADGSPDVSPDPAPDPDPDPDPDANAPSATLQNLIPSSIQSGACSADNNSYGSIAAIECSSVQGLAAQTFWYYLFASTSALNQGYSTFFQNDSFPTSCASNGDFGEFISQCQSTYTNNSLGISGTVTEYVGNGNATIASTEDQQMVMCVMDGTNGNDLVTFWSNMDWIVTSG
jgi:hypothetical protein